MAQTRKATKEGPKGIDRWTSNGYGMVFDEPKKKKATKTDKPKTKKSGSR